MKAFFVVAAVLAAALASANAKAASIHEEHPIDWYDCSQQKDGNYVHPSDCTRFISCSGGIASQRDCANCHVDPVHCPEGRLVYNSTVDRCLSADQTRCEGGGEDNPTDPTATTEPNQTDPTEPETTPEDQTETTPGGTDPPATDAPNPDPVEGDDCDPENCRNIGYCQSYLRCDKETGKWVAESCGENLAWNPLNPNGTDQIHGGNCDLWDNLSPEVERKYRTDKDCLACFWEARGECNQEYDYQPPNGTHRNVLRLSCAEGLVFSQEKETCQRCEDVKRSDGSACC